MGRGAGFPVQFLYRPDSVPELAALAMDPYLAGQRAARRSGHGRPRRLRHTIFQPGRIMKHINQQNIAILAGMAALCALAFLCLGLSPALTATLSRGADFGPTLS